MWKDDGSGPAGWTDILPLPLHWFVFSTGSTINKYIFVENRKYETGSGHLHMEKNWGQSFPSAWIWA